MDRVVALLQRKDVLAALAVVLVGVVALTWWTMRGDDDTEPLAVPSATATSSTPPPTTATPTPTPSSDVPCEGPDTISNPEGVQLESLLPDCGKVPVTRVQQEEQGLGLGCGGTYPVILYKTTAKGAEASICGTTSSGENLRVVIQPDGEKVRDLEGEYDYTVDGFVAEDGDTTWTVLAYDGSINATRDGRTSSSGEGDWMSLDNEPDYD